MIEEIARKLLSTTLQRVHLVPGGQRHHVVSVLVCNTDATARRLTLKKRKANGDADAESSWFYSYPLSSNDTKIFAYLTSLGPGEELLGSSDAADKVTVHVNGWKGGSA